MHTAPTASSLLAQAAERLPNRLERDLLLCQVLRCDRTHLFAHPEMAVDPLTAAQFLALVLRRSEGFPMAYLLGHREFYGRDFAVNSAVLIPRPETELLIDWALHLGLDQARVADVGTGSGCIALTLACERPDWLVVAIDRSPEALAVCQDNRRALSVDSVITLEGDLLAPVRGQRFELILSNPPYVAADDPHLLRGDLVHEPAIALAAGNEGLSVLQRIIAQAPAYLKPNGWLLLEHGYDQAEAVAILLAEAGFADIECRRDLAGLERASGARWPGDEATG
jgi:release factor glutamine methyltransferase